MTINWINSTLGSACDMYQPKTISMREMSQDGEFPVYGANGVIGRYHQYNHEEPQLLVTCRGATCGSVNVSAPKSWITGNAMVVRPKVDGLSARFLEYFFRGGVDISIAITGAAQPQITRSNLEPISISYPSLLEQQRIVTVLDEAFEGIAAASANAEKNLSNAREVFHSKLQSTFADYWSAGNLTTLSDLAAEITDGDHMPPPKAPHGVPFITIGNVQKDTRTIDFSDTFKVPKEYFSQLKPHKKPKQGDVLYTVTGSFGIPVLITEDRDFCFQRHIGLVRPKSAVNSKWLYYLLMSPQIFHQANSGATGTAQKTVSLKILRNFEVPIVPRAKQDAAVEQLGMLLDESSNLEGVYQQKLNALAELKKSILHQAFTGQLH